MKNVLLVDDDPFSLLVTKNIIDNEFFSHEILISSNGSHALGEVQKIIELKKLNRGSSYPLVIFLDLDMPIMDGWDFLEHYSRHFHDNMPDTKVIILTSTMNDYTISKARKYPVVSKVLQKSFLKSSMDSLKQKLN